MQKEFFQLLLAEMYNPDFGMFVLDTDAQTFWFSKTSFEANLQFELFGPLSAGLTAGYTEGCTAASPLESF